MNYYLITYRLIHKISKKPRFGGEKMCVRVWGQSPSHAQSRFKKHFNNCDFYYRHIEILDIERA